jgi:two-component system, OmpR family, sensor kinase
MPAPFARRLVRTLRGRLLIVLLSVTVVGLLGMGFASVALLRHSLMSKVDERLTVLSGSWERGRIPPPPVGDVVTPPRGLPTEFRLVFFDQGGSFLGMAGQTRGDPSGPVADAIGSAILRPRTVPDRVGGSEWRVRTVVLPDGSRIALALSLDSVDSTVRELIVIELIVGAIVLTVLAMGAAVTVRLGLRPLTKIENTARAIADGELDRRIPDQDPATETGRLGAALNTMLGRLLAALQQREHSEQRLRRFVADASHELRTPLTSIRGFAELYRRREDVPACEVRRMMSRIEDEALRMGRLVEDLLLLARLDRERSIDLVDLDLVALVHDVVHDARARDTAREITLNAPPQGPRVLADAHRLRQVLDNLLTNALVHTIPASPVLVTVEHGSVGEHVTAAAGVEVGSGTTMGVVQVVDAGPGIPAEHAERIFDRFYRVDSGQEPSGGGTGLGLAITAAIAEAHNGRVELTQNSLGGSTFRLLIPLS